MEIVLATKNKNKIKEVKRIIRDKSISMLTIDDFPGCPEVEEDGTTFEANAVKKALAVAHYTEKPSLADDSGLEVYALNGAPGTFSSRYAGKEADDRRNIQKLLYEMLLVDEEKRGARFTCCVALAFPDGIVKTFFGYIEGRIGKEPKGVKGFGYDPVFYPEGESRSFAEMSGEEKDALSHRGKALKELEKYLRELIS